MTPEVQTYLALVVVAASALYLLWAFIRLGRRLFSSRGGSSCGGGCGCSSSSAKKETAHPVEMVRLGKPRDSA